MDVEILTSSLRMTNQNVDIEIIFFLLSEMTIPTTASAQVSAPEPADSARLVVLARW